MLSLVVVKIFFFDGFCLSGERRRQVEHPEIISPIINTGGKGGRRHRQGVMNKLIGTEKKNLCVKGKILVKFLGLHPKKGTTIRKEEPTKTTNTVQIKKKDACEE